MAVNITIPRLGTFKSDATLAEWKVKEGESVKQNETVLEIETEKIRFEIVADASGFLHILVEEGVKCPIGKVVGVIAASSEELVALQKAPPDTASAEIALTDTAAQTQTAETSFKAGRHDHIRISPAARKMAEENRIDITKLIGTGPDGRIVKEDIEKAVAAKEAASTEIEPTSGTALDSYEGKCIKYAMPLKGIRGIIAERMHKSLAESAQLTAMGEIDMTELIRLRQHFLSLENIIGTKVTYTDFCLFVAAKVLRENLIVNSSIINNEIKIWDDINIGVAVALKDGLIVPVIKNADRKSIVEISKLNKTLAEKARSGKLAPDEVSAGTFTITNLGSAGAGYRFETSIINPPESAVLGIGGITDRAVVRDGQIVIRPIMTYGFTYDHRVIDGTTAVQFMARTIELLENPGLLIL